MCPDKIKSLKHLVPLQGRTWIGTTFHHQGRTKITDKTNGAVDCIGLVVGVASELKLCDENGVLLAEYDRTDYSRLGMGKALIEVLSKHLIPIDDIEVGCVLLFRIMGQPQHVGIAAERQGSLSLIHAYQGPGKVVEHDLTKQWKDRIIQAYRFKPWQH